MRPYHHFSQAEIDIIIEEMSKSPLNMSKAFANASLKTGRPLDCIKAKWYSSIKDHCKAFKISSKEEVFPVNTKVVFKNSSSLKDSLSGLFDEYQELQKAKFQKNLKTLSIDEVVNLLHNLFKTL